MSMPPKNIDPGDLWLAIAKDQPAYRIVEFPRKGPDGVPVGELAIVVLTQWDSIAASKAADRRVQKDLKEAGGKENYETLMELWNSCELLFRCCKQADDISKPLFPTVEDIAKHLTTDEIAVLVMSYRTTQAELGPISSEMSQDEVDAWVEALAKGGAHRDPFALLSLGMQSQLMRYMASRLYASRMVSSSPGTPPADTPTS